MPKVENITDGDLMIPVGIEENASYKIPSYRRIKPGKTMEVSKETLDVCLNMGCATVGKAEDLVKDVVKTAAKAVGKKKKKEEELEEEPVEETPKVSKGKKALIG